MSVLSPPHPAEVARPPAAADPPSLTRLSHYLAGYPYRPDRYAYTEFYTTDPHYVMEDVHLMTASILHNEDEEEVSHALKILINAVLQHLACRVVIRNIPAALMAASRHTGRLVPDLAIWPFPRPAGNWGSYDFAADGPPALVVEVVSHSGAEVRDNDWGDKFVTYARMGVKEYWLLDDAEAEPLQGFGLVGEDPQQWAYQPLVDFRGGFRSAVLGVSVRWAAAHRTLQRWVTDREAWEDVYVPPAVAAAQGRAEGIEIGEARGMARERIESLWGLLAILEAWPEDADRDDYRARLAALPLDRIPTTEELGARLAPLPTGAARADAVRAFLDARLDPP